MPRVAFIANINESGINLVILIMIEKEKQWKAEWGAPIELAHGSTNARGVAILFQKARQNIVDRMKVIQTVLICVTFGELKSKYQMLCMVS